MKFKMKVIKPVTDWLTPACADITYLISKGMDTRLKFRERIQVKIHIIGCILCHRYLEQLQKIERTLKDAAHLFENKETAERNTLSTDIYNRIKTAIHRHLSN